jgi:hypothetical protein
MLPGLVCIWVAVLIYCVDLWYQDRKTRLEKAAMAKAEPAKDTETEALKSVAAETVPDGEAEVLTATIAPTSEKITLDTALGS